MESDYFFTLLTMQLTSSLKTTKFFGEFNSHLGQFIYFCVTFLILFTYLYMPDILGLLIYIDTAACKLYTVFNKFSSRGDNIGFREEAKRINIHREKTIRSSVQDVFPICYEFLVVPWVTVFKRVCCTAFTKNHRRQSLEVLTPISVQLSLEGGKGQGSWFRAGAAKVQATLSFSSYHILARKSRAAHSTPPPHNFLEQGKTQVCSVVDLDLVGSEIFDRIWIQSLKLRNFQRGLKRNM